MISLFKKYVHITLLFLATIIKRPDEYDWGKLKIILEYLKGTKHTKLRLRVEYFSVVNWWMLMIYGNKIKVHRVKIHDCLVIDLCY